MPANVGLSLELRLASLSARRLETDSMSEMPERVRDVAMDIFWQLNDRPGAWSQGAAVRNAVGNSVSLDSMYAFSWCLVGHIYRRTREDKALHRATLQAFRAVIKMPIANWNDRPGRDAAAVMRLCERVARETNS
jgi:hypothetical protein